MAAIVTVEILLPRNCFSTNTRRREGREGPRWKIKFTQDPPLHSGHIAQNVFCGTCKFCMDRLCGRPHGICAGKCLQRTSHFKPQTFRALLSLQAHHVKMQLATLKRLGALLLDSASDSYLFSSRWGGIDVCSVGVAKAEGNVRQGRDDAGQR